MNIKEFLLRDQDIDRVRETTPQLISLRLCKIHKIIIIHTTSECIKAQSQVEKGSFSNTNEKYKKEKKKKYKKCERECQASNKEKIFR